MNTNFEINNLIEQYTKEWLHKYQNEYKYIFMQFDIDKECSNVCIWSFDEYKIKDITNNSASRLHKFRPKAPELIEHDLATQPFQSKCIGSLFYQLDITSREPRIIRCINDLKEVLNV